MATGSRIGLLEAEPEFGRFLSEEQLEQAAHVHLHVHKLRGEFDFGAVLRETHAFGGLIIEGMVLERVHASDQPTLRMLGPGDLLSPRFSTSPLISKIDCNAAADTRIALLDDRILAAGQHWPRLFASLYLKSAEQAERVTAQLAICQLPRVTDRLLALMWLLAETWGRVTTAGVALPVALTHDALGGLIGARRPTVTLALRELSDRGAIIRQDLGWLLLERYEPSGPTASRSDIPVVVADNGTTWKEPLPGPGQEPLPVTHDELMASVSRLRSEHLAARERVRERLAELQVTRERVRLRRAAIRKPEPRRAPSS
jgi:hypothetical protein